MDGEVDFAIGHFSITAMRNNYLSPSDVYMFTPWILIVPPGSRYSSLEKLFGPFDFGVWMFIICIIMLAFIIIPIINNYCEYDKMLGLTSKTPYLNILLVTVGGPIRVPIKNFGKSLLMIFILYNLVLRSAYQGSLINKIQSEVRKEPIATVNELINKNYDFYLSYSMVEHMKHLAFMNK